MEGKIRTNEEGYAKMLADLGFNIIKTQQKENFFYICYIVKK